MKEVLITFPVAKLAKEKGFNLRSEPYRYNSKGELTLLEGINAPTQSLLQKWLRDMHNIDVESSLVYRVNTRKYLIKLYKNNTEVILSTFYFYETYEEALEIGLQKALKLI